MFVTNWISTTKIQKISEITNFFRHYFLSRTEVDTAKIRDNKKIRHFFYIIPHFFLRNQNILLIKQIAKRFYLSLLERLLTL